MIPVNIKVHGVIVKIYYINCAISAVLSITMTNPIAAFPSTAEEYDWALTVAVVLGALCKLGGSGKTKKKVRMVCVMYSRDTRCGSTVLICGTSKCYLAKYFKSKNEMSNLRWRQERLESLEDAIHGPSRGTLAPQTVLSRNTSPDQNRDGNCAETVPMMVAAARCSGEVVSIAIRLVNIPDWDCNLSTLVHRMEGSRNSGSNFTLFQAKACNNCLRFFNLLREKRGIRVVHGRLSQTRYPLAFMDTGR